MASLFIAAEPGHLFAISEVMRLSRSLQLVLPDGFVHKFWRCHNREYYLTDPIKSLYMACTKEALEKEGEFIKIHSFCVMDNHVHQVLHYSQSSQKLSSFMRRAHSLFGRLYNNLCQRSGKVAEGRPKTPLIQDEDHLMQVHFYVEANPVRAKKIPVEKLKQYKFSSYRYYAFGVRDKYTELLTAPQWYLALGKTAKQRQEKYRRLFAQYLESKGIEPHGFLGAFIGALLWVSHQEERVLEGMKKRTQSNHAQSNSS